MITMEGILYGILYLIMAFAIMGLVGYLDTQSKIRGLMKIAENNLRVYEAATYERKNPHSPWVKEFQATKLDNQNCFEIKSRRVCYKINNRTRSVYKILSRERKDGLEIIIMGYLWTRKPVFKLIIDREQKKLTQYDDSLEHNENKKTVYRFK